VLFPVFVAGLSFVRADVWALVAAFYGSWGVATVYRVWAARAVMSYRLTPTARRQGLAELPGILKFGLKIMPGFLAIGASNQTGTWILGASVSVSSVGAYNRAGTVAGKLGELNFRITEMLFPALVTRRQEGDTAGFDRAVVDTLRYAVVGLVASAAVLGGASRGILRLFGPGFDIAATALPMLAIVPAAMAATAVLAHTMFALNRTNATTALAGLRLLITAGGGIVLTRAFGLNGMAAASALGAIAQFVAQAVLTLRQLSTPVRRLWPFRQTLGIVAAYVLGFGAARGVDQAILGPAGLVVALAIGAVAYSGGFLVIGGLLERDRRRVMMVRDRLAAEFARRSAGHGPIGRLVGSHMSARRDLLLIVKSAGSSFAIALTIASLAALLTVLLVPGPGPEASGVLALVVAMSALALVVSNWVAARLVQRPREENVRALEGALRRVIVLACVIVAPAIVWATPMTHAMFGPADSRSADVLTAMLPFVFCCGIAPLLIHASNDASEAWHRLTVSLSTLALTATVGFILIPRHGLLGAVIAADVGFGFYTIAHIYVCRRLLKLRVRMLAWSLACGLTAAAAMALVLASVRMTAPTTSDWLEGGVGGLAVYLAMLIFTRELAFADLTRATAALGSRVVGLRLRRGRSWSPSPAQVPTRRVPVGVSDSGGERAAGASAGMLASTASQNARRHACINGPHAVTGGGSGDPQGQVAAPRARRAVPRQSTSFNREGRLGTAATFAAETFSILVRPGLAR
jgi:O-antigen/teichoic acid export membrane protein